MLLPQTASVPLPTPVEGLNNSSKNKITKGGMRQAQDRQAEENYNRPSILGPQWEDGE